MTSVDNNTFMTSIKQMTADQTAESIRNIAKVVSETSPKIRQKKKTLHHSGAIDQFTQAVHEAVLAARDTAKEINETSKDLKERGIIKDTANVMEETTMVSRETLQVAKDTTYDVGEVAPESTKKLQKGSGPVKQEIRRRTSKTKSKRQE